MSEELTRVISREQAEEWGLPHEVADSEELAAKWETALQVHTERLEERRWYAIFRLIFRAPDDGQTWGVTYKQGLTESQEQDPFDEAKTVTLTRYEPYEKTVTAWRPVVTDAPDSASDAIDAQTLHDEPGADL